MKYLNSSILLRDWTEFSKRAGFATPMTKADSYIHNTSISVLSMLNYCSELLIVLQAPVSKIFNILCLYTRASFDFKGGHV